MLPVLLVINHLFYKYIRRQIIIINILILVKIILKYIHNFDIKFILKIKSVVRSVSFQSKVLLCSMF